MVLTLSYFNNTYTTTYKSFCDMIRVVWTNVGRSRSRIRFLYLSHSVVVYLFLFVYLFVLQTSRHWVTCHTFSFWMPRTTRFLNFSLSLHHTTSSLWTCRITRYRKWGTFQHITAWPSLSLIVSLQNYFFHANQSLCFFWRFIRNLIEIPQADLCASLPRNLKLSIWVFH